MDRWRADFATSPPFRHLAPWAGQLAAPDWPELATLNRMASDAQLVNAAGRPVQFQPQTQRCGQRDYEAGILTSGTVPTRGQNWHDLLNALTWLAFPHTKAALNAVQCAALGAERTGGRGAISDAATLFDESGLVLAGPDPALAELLAARCWREAFVDRRADWRGVRAYAVGHAVLEKLLAPWPGVTAKCLFVKWDEAPGDGEEAGAPDAGLDQAIASLWRTGQIRRPADLFPLPVLGIPGWWPGNESAEFYDDRRVFRPAAPA